MSDDYADLLAPNPNLFCASCGKPGAVAGYGGPPDIPACEACITTLPSTEFQARIEAWRQRAAAAIPDGMPTHGPNGAKVTRWSLVTETVRGGTTGTTVTARVTCEDGTEWDAEILAPHDYRWLGRV